MEWRKAESTSATLRAGLRNDLSRMHQDSPVSSTQDYKVLLQGPQRTSSSSMQEAIARTGQGDLARTSWGIRTAAIEDAVMDRRERRYRTEKIARKRLASCPEKGAGQQVGWFRKWNMTCRCKMCMISRYCGIQFQRWKDDRRAPLATQ